VFCKIKFISNDDVLREAMDWVMKHEKVPQEKRLMYWVVYESVFNESLNAKRSTCETAGRKIVVDETMPKFKEKGKELFIMEELCKLRRAETEREKEASFWFFGEFLSWHVRDRRRLDGRRWHRGQADAYDIADKQTSQTAARGIVQGDETQTTSQTSRRHRRQREELVQGYESLQSKDLNGKIRGHNLYD
jgi:hypothetical protein